MVTLSLNQSDAQFLSFSVSQFLSFSVSQALYQWRDIPEYSGNVDATGMTGVWMPLSMNFFPVPGVVIAPSDQGARCVLTCINMY
jgi:hypothetical protein